MRSADYTPDRDSARGRARVSNLPLRGLQRPAMGTREDRWRGQVWLARLIRRATDGLQRAIPNVGRVAHPAVRTFNDIFATRSTIGSSRSVSFNSRKTSSKAVTIALTTSGSKTRPCSSRRIGTSTSDMERPLEALRSATRAVRRPGVTPVTPFGNELLPYISAEEWCELCRVLLNEFDCYSGSRPLIGCFLPLA
jgi:hypothetical protein